VGKKSVPGIKYLPLATNKERSIFAGEIANVKKRTVLQSSRKLKALLSVLELEKVEERLKEARKKKNGE